MEAPFQSLQPCQPNNYSGFGGVTERNGLFKPKHITITLNSACSFL